MSDLFSEALIDLGAIKRNYQRVVDKIGFHTVCSAVLKSNAYGLGAAEVAKALYSANCHDFWVAYITEAIELRQYLPEDANISYLQGFNPNDIPDIKKFNLIPVINSMDELAVVSDIEIVVHVDTGLTRLGIRPEDIDSLCSLLPDLRLKYVISHLACSTDSQSSFNHEQQSKFNEIVAKLRQQDPTLEAGLSSSFGVFINDSFSYDIARLGGYLYGIRTPNCHPENVLSLTSPVLERYQVQKGTDIGYGATYTTTSDTTVAVISIGYADGIRRSLSNVGKVFFYDENENCYEARMLGLISMDLLVCDVTNIPEALTARGKRACLLNENYNINKMALDAGTVAYEILTGLSFNPNRIRKVYQD